MGTQSNDSLLALIQKQGLRLGKAVIDDSTEVAATASTPLYIDANSKLAQGNIPFVLPLSAGATDTSFAVEAIVGSATGSDNELMHLTLVKASNTTAVAAGYYRVTITDNAGVITSGNYYAPFYTLT